ncbi:MAG: hypothetical protein AB7G44_16945 [Bacteroidia bacterium]
MKRALPFLIFLILSVVCSAQDKYDVLYLKNGGFIRGKIIEQSDTGIIQINSLEGNTFFIPTTETDSLKLQIVENNPPHLLKPLDKSIIVTLEIGYSPSAFHHPDGYGISREKYSFETDSFNMSRNISSGINFGASITKIFTKKIGSSINLVYHSNDVIMAYTDMQNVSSPGKHNYYSELKLSTNCFRFSNTIKLHTPILKNFHGYLDLGYCLSLSKLEWNTSSNDTSQFAYFEHWSGQWIFGNVNTTNINTKETTPLKINLGIYYSVGLYIRLYKPFYLTINYSAYEIFKTQITEYNVNETKNHNGTTEVKNYKLKTNEDNSGLHQQAFYQPTLNSRSFNIGLSITIK